MRPPRPSKLLAVLACGLLAGCWQESPRAEPLRVDRTSPVLDDESQPVLLNDSLTVYFTEEILPLSVTPDSVTVLDERGHQVPGSLQVGPDWVAFEPDVPLAPDLLDGSFRPGADYRLMLAGYPRPDGIRTRDGQWLEKSEVFDVHVASEGQQPAGLPSLLRPPANRLPLLMRRLDEHLPADAPQLQLHFTQPLLPSSVTADAFEVLLLEEPVARLEPRSVRLVTSPLDVLPGCTVEIDLGVIPRRTDGSKRRLQDGDLICVMPPNGLRDLAGDPPLSLFAKNWLVSEGASLPLCEWPSPEEGGYDAADLLPGFEHRHSTIRPRVRVEAGNAQLGAFRPTRDTMLRPGQPFDRGDGQFVVSEAGDFSFLSIDIPEGVTVTVDATGGPVRLRACGGVRIAGQLLLQSQPVELPKRTQYTQPVSELIAVAPVSVVAAGEIQIIGDVRASAPVAGGETMLLLATAAGLRLGGSLPFQTMLVAQAGPGAEAMSRIEGPRGQSRVYAASFTMGLAPGADLPVRGVLPWRQLPAHLDSGSVQLVERRGALSVQWQSAPPDPIQGDRPDLSAGLVGRWQTARDQQVIVIGSGAFVRFELRCQVQADRPLPGMRALRVVAN